MSTGTPVLIEIHEPSMLEAVVRLRARVWEETGTCAANAFAAGAWRDATDDVARHWCVLRGEEIVAAARLSIHATLAEVPEAGQYLRHGLRLAGPVAAPARVVVAASIRRQGIAAMLLDAQARATREAGAASAVRQAAPAMRPSLLRRGWREVGGALPDPMFPGVEFIVMVLQGLAGEKR